MGDNKTAEWGDELAVLVAQAVSAHPPAENVVNAHLTGIDGSGTAALVSKLKKGTDTYDGFALVFHHDTHYQSFEWLQFITRQLVVNHTAKKGTLIFQTNTTSYQLVDSAAEVTDFAFASGSKPDNWNTCWKVDSKILPTPKPFFRDTYEYAISADKKITAILDAPSAMTGRVPLAIMKDEYVDCPSGLVVMRDLLGEHSGIARAYFSDYLVKKDGDKWHIFARFDFSLTWNVTKDSKGTDKKNFTLHSLKATPTTQLLECHKAALLHKTTENVEPWKSFGDSIHS